MEGNLKKFSKLQMLVTLDLATSTCGMYPIDNTCICVKWCFTILFIAGLLIEKKSEKINKKNGILSSYVPHIMEL